MLYNWSQNLGTVPSPFYILRGAIFLRANPVLWKYATAPIAISIVVLGGSYYLLYHLVSGFVSPYASAAWYWQALYYTLLTVLTVAFLVVFFFLFTRVASAIAAPFNELISQKTEELVTGTFHDTPFSIFHLLKDSGRSIWHSLKILAIYLTLLLTGLLLLLIPGIGSLLFTMLGALLSAFMLSFEYLGYPMDRRRFSWAEKRAFFRSRIRSVMGFGLGNLAVASVPLLNLLFIPAAVIGGTLLFLDLNASTTGVSESPRPMQRRLADD